MATHVNDLRYALRLFVKDPALTIAAVLSLAIGIGANTAIFSVTHALLLRPLPYADPDRLVILWNRSPGLNITEDWFSTAQYFDIRNGSTSFDQVAIAIGANYNLTGDGDPERVGVIRVSSNLLPMLGVMPLLGQLFTADDDGAGRPALALLGHGTWTRRYGSNPGIVGTSIVLNGQSVRVAGVLPDGFLLPREVLPTLGVAETSEIILSLPLPADAPTIRGREDYNIIGRLKRGVSVAQAQAEMDAITARLRREFPDIYPATGGLTFSIVPLMDQVVGDVRRPLLVLLGAVGFVLLIACANVANLLLSRALARQKEIAVRASLGASHRRILQQLFTESVLLASIGGLAGVALAAAGVRWIHVLQPKNVPRLADIGISWEVLAFTTLISVVCGVLFGLAPAIGLRRLDLHGTLKDASRGSAGTSAVWGRGGHNLRRLLVVGELGLAVVLLIGAGLLIRSFARLQDVPPGFDSRGVLAFELTMTGERYATAPIVRQTYRELWDRLDRLPGVAMSGGVTSLPLSGYFAWGPITVEGRPLPPGETFINADQRVVSGRYFQTMRVPLVSGRFFTDQDTPETPRVVIVDEFMARELWPGENAVGKRIRFGDIKSTGPWQTVVGVVGRVKQYDLETDGRIAVYLPHTQTGTRAFYATVRTDGDPGAIAAAVAQQVREIDPNLPVYRVRPMGSLVEQSLARRRFSMTLLALFAAVALVLAIVGVYGVMSYLVSQGTREIGIRMALGATPGGILALVLRQGTVIALAGVGIGLVAAFVLARLIESLLFGVDSRDPATFAVVALLLATIGVGATYVPARRASRTDPMVSLGRE